MINRETYQERCKELASKIKESLPNGEGWKWVIVMQNDVVGEWASASNLSNEDTVRLLDAAAKTRKAPEN